MKPGDRLRAFAQRFCEVATIERVLDPLIADLQFEHDKAERAGRIWHAHKVRISAYLAFWTTFAMCAGRGVQQWAAEDEGAIGRTMRFLVGANVVIAAVFTLIPLSRLSTPPGVSTTALVAYLIPQALSVSLPFALPLAVAIAMRGHVASRRVFRSILVIAAVCMVVDLVLCGWILPASNQAFRVMLSGRSTVERGANELTFGELIARLSNGPAWPPARDLLVSLHARLAISAAPVILAWFGLLIPMVVRRNSLACFAICIAALTYPLILIAMEPTAYAEGWPPMWALIWLPNMFFAGASAIFAIIANNRQRAQG